MISLHKGQKKKKNEEILSTSQQLLLNSVRNSRTSRLTQISGEIPTSTRELKLPHVLSHTGIGQCSCQNHTRPTLSPTARRLTRGPSNEQGRHSEGTRALMTGIDSIFLGLAINDSMRFPIICKLCATVPLLSV
jgi:hypothetical protein